MATNIEIDPALVEEARTLGGHKTKRETFEAALREYVRLRKCRRILAYFGQVEFDEDYDYKSSRSR